MTDSELTWDTEFELTDEERAYDGAVAEREAMTVAERNVSAEDARRALITGLAGPHQDLFARSAAFHATITTLADFLPLMVNGLAEHAEGADAEYQARLAAIKSAPSKTWAEVEGL